jgi:hypothetical protein
MATEAARLRRRKPQGGRRKTDLTLTGLLMEGVSPPLRGPLVGDKRIPRQLSNLLFVKLVLKLLPSRRQNVSNCEGGLMPPYLPSADVTRELPLFQKRRQMRSGI